MAKSGFNKKLTVNASGILHIDDQYVGVENIETGEMIDLAMLFEDFADRTVKISINYDEDLCAGDD